MKSIPQEQVILLHSAVGEILDVFAQASWQSQGDFGHVEQAASAAILKLRGALLSVGLQLSSESSCQTRLCPTCHTALHAWSQPTRRVVTAEGEGAYNPIRYRCLSCAADYYPLEEANGLRGSQFTTRAKGLIAETGADLPFGHVSRSLDAERGLSVSAKEVDRTMREVSAWRAQEEKVVCDSVYGEEAALLRAAGTDPLSAAPDLHGFASWPGNAKAMVSVDGAMVRSTSKGEDGLEWFECRAGLIRSVSREERQNGRPVSFHTGGVCTPDALFDQLGATYQKAVPAGTICVFVADGARWIWDRARLYFPQAIQVLDFYHACDHIDSAATAWFGERSHEAIAWRQRARRMLAEQGGVRAVLRELLKALGEPKQVADVRELQTEVRYLLAHRHRMRYHYLKSRGLPIGSGAMESAIKQLATARLRMPGMKWSRQGADAVLRVRSAHMSNSLRITTARRHATLQKAAMDRYSAPVALAA